MGRDAAGNPLVPGYNVDRINYDAGLAELTKCGYTAPRIRQVILYALQRWARGEEAAAERAAVDHTFYGVDFTSWRRVLAAAVAHAQPPVIGHPLNVVWTLVVHWFLFTPDRDFAAPLPPNQAEYLTGSAR